MFKVGDKVRITNRISPYYGETGEIVRVGELGGLFVMHSDGMVAYHPWGFEITVQERS